MTIRNDKPVMEPAMADLFILDRALTPAERKRMQRRASEVPRGHAWAPGTGPDGETCGTCEHRVRVCVGAKTISKCGKNRAAWTGSIRTDIRANDAACKFWDAALSTNGNGG